MKNFINRPIPRLLRYELLLKSILEQTPEGSTDLETIPMAIHLIKSLGKETESGVCATKQKVDLWRFQANLIFKPGEAVVCKKFLSATILIILAVGHGVI